MALRVCAESGCPELTRSTRCTEHTRERDRARGSASDRGYGRDHRALRRHYADRMKRGETFTCWRCGHPIDPASFDLGHCDDDRTVTHGPENLECNRATASHRATRCPHPSHQ